MTNEELLKIAYTRELTDERVRIAAAYWLDCSPHEQTTADGVILARYARNAMNRLAEQEKTIKEMQEALEWYANKDNYDPIHLSKHGWIPIDKDEGERARTALGDGDEE